MREMNENTVPSSYYVQPFTDHDSTRRNLLLNKFKRSRRV